MSAIVKGKQGASLEKIEKVYDADAQTYAWQVTWKGTQAAISGVESQYFDEGISYEIRQEGAVHLLFATVPQFDPEDTYEIFTEGTEKSIFEFPHIVETAANYDASIAVGDPTWRSLTEDAVLQKATHGSIPGTVEYDVVNALRNGVTGWQVDFTVIRRRRRIKRLFAFASSGQLNLDLGLFIYTHAQLVLPPDVAFVLPTVPAQYITAQYEWGWRRRSQGVEIVGQWFEQRIELLFAPWSLIFYIPSSTNLNW